MKQCFCPARLFTLGLVLLAQWLPTPICSAATRSWDGGGTNNFWDAAANWSSNAAPVNGDSVIFPDSVSRLNNTNRVTTFTNISSLRFNGDGYQIFSVPLTINQGITNVPSLLGSPNTLNAVIQIRSNQTWFVGTRRSLTLNSNIVFPTLPITLTLDVGTTGSLDLNGRLLGNSQIDVLKLGGGRLDLSGSTNTVHSLILADGFLNLDGFLNSLLVVSNGAILQGTGRVQSATCAGELRPAGINVGRMTFLGTNSILQAGARLLLQLNGLTAGVDHDQLRASGLQLDGPELVLQLTSTNFLFGIGQKFVIIENPSSGAAPVGTFANLPQGGFLTNNGIVFQIDYSGGNGNDVVLQVADVPFVPTGVTRIWDGGTGALELVWQNQFNWDNDALPKRGDDLVFSEQASLSRRVMTNNFDATNGQFHRLWFGGHDTPWIVHGNGLKIFGGLAFTNGFLPRGEADLRCASVELGQAQTWSVTNFLVRVATPLSFGGNTLTVASAAGGNEMRFESQLLGPGTLVLRQGTVGLSTNVAISNVAVRVEGGILQANNQQATGPEWELVGGQLALNQAQIPGLNATGGQLKCRSSGQATIAGNLTLAPGCALVASFEEATSPLLVSGTLTLSNASLIIGVGNTSLAGPPFTLIDNAGTNAINGTFGGLPEGALVACTNSTGAVFDATISYVGGDGNDVTLTIPKIPPQFNSIARLANGDVRLLGSAGPGATVKIEATEDFQTFQLLGTTVASLSGKFEFIDSPGAVAQRFYRAFTP